MTSKWSMLKLCYHPILLDEKKRYSLPADTKVLADKMIESRIQNGFDLLQRVEDYRDEGWWPDPFPQNIPKGINFSAFWSMVMSISPPCPPMTRHNLHSLYSRYRFCRNVVVHIDLYKDQNRPLSRGDLVRKVLQPKSMLRPTGDLSLIIFLVVAAIDLFTRSVFEN